MQSQMSMPKKKAVRRRKAEDMLEDTMADTMLADTMMDDTMMDAEEPVEASVVKKESKAKRPRTMTMTSCFESMLTNMQGLSTLVQGLTYKVDDMQSLSSQLNIKVEKLSERVDQAQAEQMQTQTRQAQQQMQAEPKQAQAQAQQMQQMQAQQMQQMQHMQKVQPRQELLIQVDAIQEQHTLQTLLAGMNVTEEHMNRMYEAPTFVNGVSKVILDVISEAGSLRVHGRDLLVKEHDSNWMILTHPGLLQILLYVGKALFTCFVEWSKHLKAPFSEFDDNGDKHAALHKSILVDGYFLLKTKLVPGKVDVQGKLVKHVHSELRKLLNE